MADFDKLFDAMYVAFLNDADSSMWTKKAAVEAVLDAIAANTPECHCHESRRVKIMAEDNRVMLNELLRRAEPYGKSVIITIPMYKDGYRHTDMKAAIRDLCDLR